MPPDPPRLAGAKHQPPINVRSWHGSVASYATAYGSMGQLIVSSKISALKQVVRHWKERRLNLDRMEKESRK